MFNEFFCQLFEKHPDGGDPTPIPGGGLISGSLEECRQRGIKSVGKEVRKWDRGETTAHCVGYKIWQRVE